MTGWGEKLDDVPTRELLRRVQIDRTTKPVWRLVAAIEYQHGLTPAGFEAKYGIPRDTVYTWLDRFVERGIDSALHDEPRPGRPPKLAPDERHRFVDALHRPPRALGYDAETWRPRIAQRYLEDEFGVDYSRRHVARLLAEVEV